MNQFWNVTEAETLKETIRKNAYDINHIDDEGNGPLILWAAEHTKDPDLIKTLVECGADANGIKDDTSPLGSACAYNNNIDIIKTLIDLGADVNQVFNNGCTALHYACMNDNVEVVKLMLDQGCDIEAKDEKGETPLFNALNNGNIEVLKAILDAGPNVLHVNNYGQSALMVALVDEVELPHIRLLVNAGADIHTYTVDGYTALDVACMYKHKMGNLDIVNFLKSKGAEHSDMYKKEIEQQKKEAHGNFARCWTEDV